MGTASPGEIVTSGQSREFGNEPRTKSSVQRAVRSSKDRRYSSTLLKESSTRTLNPYPGGYASPFPGSGQHRDRTVIFSRMDMGANRYAYRLPVRVGNPSEILPDDLSALPIRPRPLFGVAGEPEKETDGDAECAASSSSSATSAGTNARQREREREREGGQFNVDL